MSIILSIPPSPRPRYIPEAKSINAIIDIDPISDHSYPIKFLFFIMAKKESIDGLRNASIAKNKCIYPKFSLNIPTPIAPIPPVNSNMENAQEYFFNNIEAAISHSPRIIMAMLNIYERLSIPRWLMVLFDILYPLSRKAAIFKKMKNSIAPNRRKIAAHL